MYLWRSQKSEYIETIGKAGFKDVEIISQNTFHESGLDERLSGKITSVKVGAFK